MTISKKTMSLGMPWEKEYGYAQALQVRDTIYISGQVSHDDKGNIVGRGNMDLQMRQAYANIQKVLAKYKATLENVVDEVLFVTDMEQPLRRRSSAGTKSFPALLLWQALLSKYNASHSLN